MKYKDVKLNCFVQDQWSNDTMRGRVVKILKTRIKILTSSNSGNGLLTYDLSHIQFLEKCKRIPGIMTAAKWEKSE